MTVRSSVAPQVRELRDDELENVSSGLDASKNEVAVEGTVRVTKFKIEPTSFEFRPHALERVAPLRRIRELGS